MRSVLIDAASLPAVERSLFPIIDIILFNYTHVDGASIQTPFLPVVFVQVFLVQPWTMTAPSLPFGLLHFAAPSMFGASRRSNELSSRTLILSEAMLITFTLNVAPLQACS